MIRRLEEKDIERVMNIWLKTNKEAHNFIPEQYWDDNYNVVKKMIGNAEVYIFEENSNIEGFVGLMENYIAGIFVEKDYQCKGVGRELLDYIKKIKSNLNLYVYKKNEKAVDFYLREKFLKSEEKTDEYHDEVEYHMVWKS